LLTTFLMITGTKGDEPAYHGRFIVGVGKKAIFGPAMIL